MAQVKAFSLGGLGAPCCCAATSTQICITACSPSLPVYGALVQLFTGATLVDSCTTGPSGCCTVPLSGRYTVRVVVAGVVAYEAARNLSGTVAIALSGAAGLVCCGGYAIPTSLTLTDSEGSLPFDYYPDFFYPIWYGGHAATRLSASATTPNNVCVVGAPTRGPVRVCYQMICQAGSTPVFNLQRSWSWVYLQGTLTPIWYQDTTGFLPGQPCATAPPAACGSPHTDSSSFGADPSSTTPFTLSGTPAPSAGNYTDDPVGGTVVISA